VAYPIIDPFESLPSARRSGAAMKRKDLVKFADAGGIALRRCNARLAVLGGRRRPRSPAPNASRNEARPARMPGDLEFPEGEVDFDDVLAMSLLRVSLPMCSASWNATSAPYAVRRATTTMKAELLTRPCRVISSVPSETSAPRQIVLEGDQVRLC
jgi:hypothetical protein